MKGVAPYLLIWIGTIAGVPALLWVLGEARAARVFVTGALFVAPFVVECLSLPHSAVGFYLIAAFVLVALGLYAFLGSDPSVRGFILRAVAASLVFAVCCICRASTLALAPGFGVALFAALRRVAPRASRGGWIRQCLLAGLVTAAFVTPYFALRPAQEHTLWSGVWQGLGDYGTDRGCSWHDRDLKRWLVANGRKPFEHPRYVNLDDEAFVREAVLRDIRSNPLWLASIFGRRFVDTVSLAKLAPYGPLDRSSILPPPLHYKYTTPVDWFGFGRRKVEVPTRTFSDSPSSCSGSGRGGTNSGSGGVSMPSSRAQSMGWRFGPNPRRQAGAAGFIKVLRVHRSEVERIGSQKTIQIDVRLVDADTLPLRGDRRPRVRGGLDTYLHRPHEKDAVRIVERWAPARTAKR